MLRALTPTEVAFVMLALMQASLTIVWLVGAWAAAETRGATVRWAAYAALSAASFGLLTAALRTAPAEAEWIRAAGNICGVLAMLALQQGVWAFLGLAGQMRQHAIALALVLVAAGIGVDPNQGFVRVGVNSAVLTWICLTMAQELHRHARDHLRMRWPLLLPLPLLFAALGFAQRGLRALADPASVAAQMAADSALNVGSAFSYIPIALAFHAVLLTLVVARLLAELRWRSRHDGLTGALNRRSMEELLAEQLRRSRRSAEPFVVLMLDLDHFKAINDRHGHAAGDLALRHAVAQFTAALRKVDGLGRFGGEEFVVLLPGLALDEAEMVGERLRLQIGSTPLEHAGVAVHMSVSIGVAAWRSDEDLSRLLVRADQALYRAKQRGRDRVESDVGAAEPVLGLA